MTARFVLAAVGRECWHPSGCVAVVVHLSPPRGAPNSMAKTTASMFVKAINQDSKSTESSLVFLRRALMLMSLTVVVIAAVLMSSEQPLIEAMAKEDVMDMECQRVVLHSVRLSVSHTRALTASASYSA